MPKIYFCGKCEEEFTPEPAIYCGDRLCSSCREKVSEDIQKAKQAYSRMSREDRDEIGNFATVASRSFSEPTIKRICGRCDVEVDDGENLCSSCSRDVENEIEEEKEKRREARERFEERMRNLR